MTLASILAATRRAPLPMFPLLVIGAMIMAGQAAAQTAAGGEAYGKPGGYYVQPRDAPPPPDPLADLPPPSRTAVEGAWNDIWQSDRDVMQQLGVDGQRSGAILTLPLEDDRVIYLVDDVALCESSDRCVIHSFDDFIVQRYLVVSVLDYESAWSYLIDRQTASVQKIVSFPLLAPDESFALSAAGAPGEEAIELIWFGADGATIDAVEIDSSCTSQPAWSAELQREWTLVRPGPDKIELRLDDEPEPGAIVTHLERHESRWRAVCSHH